jgi:hypothetical protein
MELNMFTKRAVLALIMVFSAVAAAKPNFDAPNEELDEHEINSLYETCGDNILCYFSDAEVREALGPMYDAQNVEQDFKIDGAGLSFAAEQLFEVNAGATAENDVDTAVMTDVSSRNRTSKKKESKKTAKKKTSSDDAGPIGFKGISPRGYPIWASFVGKFRQCAKGCVPYIVSVNRPGAVSCHNGGKAIDVGGLVCSGKTYMAIKRGRFDTFVGCMKGKMKTLYRQAHKLHLGITQAHYDHAHFSNGCTVQGGRRWY